MNVSIRAGNFAAESLQSPLNGQIHLPLVTFIVTNFNYGRFVIQAIDSVAAQSYGNVECIIVDDCSTDGSAELVQRYVGQRGDPRFRVIRLGANLGQMGAMKAGLENASGVFVTFLDADDLLLPDFASRHVEAHLNSAFSGGVTACDTFQIDGEGNILELTFHMLAKSRSSEASGAIKPISARNVPAIADGQLTFPAHDGALCYVDRTLPGWRTSACSSLMFRRQLLNLIAPQDVAPFRISADYYFGTFAHLIAGTIIIPDSLVYWRLHQSNNFSNNPLVGGRHLPGAFSHGRKMNEQIARHVVSNFNTLRGVIGDDLCRDIVRRYLPRHKLYRASKKAKAFRNVFSKGRPRLFWLKYGMFYRLLKKK